MSVAVRSAQICDRSAHASSRSTDLVAVETAPYRYDGAIAEPRPFVARRWIDGIQVAPPAFV